MKLSGSRVANSLVSIAVVVMIISMAFIVSVAPRASAAATASVSTNMTIYDQNVLPFTHEAWSNVYFKGEEWGPNVWVYRDGVFWHDHLSVSGTGSHDANWGFYPGVGVHQLKLIYATGWDKVSQGYKIAEVTKTFSVIQGTYHTEYCENTPGYLQGVSSVLSVADMTYSSGSAVKIGLRVTFHDASEIELGYMEGWYMNAAGELIQIQSPMFYMEYNIYTGGLDNPYTRNFVQLGAAAIGTSHTLAIRLQSTVQSNGCWLWAVYIDGTAKYGSIPIMADSAADNHPAQYIAFGECYNQADKTIGRAHFTSLKQCYYAGKRHATLKWYPWTSVDIVYQDPPWDCASGVYNQPLDWFDCWIP